MQSGADVEFTGRHGKISPEKLQQGLRQTDQNGNHFKYQLWQPRQGLSRPNGVGLFSGAIKAISNSSGIRQTGQPSLLIAHSDKVEGFSIGSPNVYPEWMPPPPSGSGYESPEITDSDTGVFEPFFWFQWNPLDYTDHYDILEDDQKIGETEDTEFSVEDPDAGEHRYEVQPVYEDGTVGEPTPVLVDVPDPGWAVEPDGSAADEYDSTEDTVAGVLQSGQDEAEASFTRSDAGIFTYRGQAYVELAEDPGVSTATPLVGLKVTFASGSVFELVIAIAPSGVILARRVDLGSWIASGGLGAWNTYVSASLTILRDAIGELYFKYNDGPAQGPIGGTWTGPVSSSRVTYGSTGAGFSYASGPGAYNLTWS
jgi:hypothetical protein